MTLKGNEFKSNTRGMIGIEMELVQALPISYFPLAIEKV